MGITEEGGKAVGSIVDALKAQPLALALVLVNIMYLALGYWTLKVAADRAEARDAAIVKLASRECVPVRQGDFKLQSDENKPHELDKGGPR
jgi:hypothetical protein